MVINIYRKISQSIITGLSKRSRTVTKLNVNIDHSGVQSEPQRQKNMTSRIAELEAEKKRLEAKVVELVDQLESKKAATDIKVGKEYVIRSKEEQEASAKLEQLAISEEQKAPQTKVEPSTGDKDKVSAKKAPKEKQPKTGTKGGATNEPERAVDISRLDLRVGRIVEVDKHPDADALYVEKIDCGDSTGPRTVISGLVKHVPIEEMRNRLVVVLCNLKPAKMRGILSEAMVMCGSTPEKVELVGVPPDAKPGDRVVFESYSGEPDAQLNPKKKIWEQVSVDIKTDSNGVATYKNIPFKLASNPSAEFKCSLKNVQIR